MSTRFDAAADGYLRTNPNVGPTALYTILTWVYRIGTPAAFGTIYSLNTNDEANNFNIDAILVNSSGQLLSYVGDGLDSGFSNPGTVLTLNTWFFVAGANISMTNYSTYVNGVLDQSNPYVRTGRSAAFTREEEANNYSSNNYELNCRLFNTMFYTRVLSAGEIAAQMASFYPLYPADLRFWTPHLAGATVRHLDYSPNLLHWTAEGTLTDEANPASPVVQLGVSPTFISFGLATVEPATVEEQSLDITPAAVSFGMSSVDPTVDAMNLDVTPAAVTFGMMVIAPTVMGGDVQGGLGDGDTPGFVAFMVATAIYNVLHDAGASQGLNVPSGTNAAEWDDFLN